MEKRKEDNLKKSEEFKERIKLAYKRDIEEWCYYEMTRYVEQNGYMDIESFVQEK